MNEKTFTEIVAGELQNSLSNVKEEELTAMAEIIRPEKKIFCDGTGRSRLQVNGFAMRLAQMGFTAAVVGDPTVSAIREEDILLICSASGETPMMVAHAKKAREIGAKILLITAAEQSSLALICDHKIVIHASSKNQVTDASVQPMGSLFEQSAGVLLDILVLHLMEKNGISNQDMALNHANLE